MAHFGQAAKWTFLSGGWERGTGVTIEVRRKSGLGDTHTNAVAESA